MRRTGLTQPQRSVIIGLYQVPMWSGKCFGLNAPAKSGILAADDRGGDAERQRRAAGVEAPAAESRGTVRVSGIGANHVFEPGRPFGPGGSYSNLPVAGV